VENAHGSGRATPEPAAVRRRELVTLATVGVKIFFGEKSDARGGRAEHASPSGWRGPAACIGSVPRGTTRQFDFGRTWVSNLSPGVPFDFGRTCISRCGRACRLISGAPPWCVPRAAARQRRELCTALRAPRSSLRQKS